MKKIITAASTAAFAASAALVLGTSGTVFAQANATSTPPVMANAMSVNIGDNGNTTLRGSVTGISSSTFTVSSWLGSYVVDVSNAKLSRRYGGASSISEFQTGDAVTVWGAASQSNLSVTASRVQDMTIYDRGVHPTGIISNLSASSSSFTLTTGGSNPQVFTITATASTKIHISSLSGQVTFANLANGMSAEVWGTRNSNSNTVIASSITGRVHNIHYWGKTSNMNAANGTFTLTTNDHGAVQVMLTADARIRINGGPAMVGDLDNGMSGQVWGYYTSDPAVVTANRVRLNFSGPRKNNNSNNGANINTGTSTSVQASTTIQLGAGLH